MSDRGLPDMFQVLVSILGLIAGIASFRTGWKATALPRPQDPPAEEAEKADTQTTVTQVGYDVST